MLAYVRECAKITLALVRKDAWFYTAVAAYTGVCIVLLAAAGRFDLSSHSNYIGQWTYLFLWLMPAFAIGYEGIRIFVRFDRGRWRVCRKVFSPGRVAHLVAGMAMMMGLMVFQGSFTSIKNLFPVFHSGFPYDRLHADIDAWLHFNHAPWELLHGIFGSHTVLRVLEWNYNAFWFLICFGGLFFVVTAPGARAVRNRYLIMFMFVWAVCGNLLAGFFLSAGPVFYGEVTGDTQRFAGLEAFIATSEGFSSASEFQTYLWTLYERGMAGFGSGISAFPSVHVGLITMNALFFAERSRVFAVVGALYTLLILASSVFLGWHYAIDGYVSILVVTAAHFALRHRLRNAAGQERMEPAGAPALVPAE